MPLYSAALRGKRGEFPQLGIRGEEEGKFLDPKSPEMSYKCLILFLKGTFPSEIVRGEATTALEPSVLEAEAFPYRPRKSS